MRKFKDFNIPKHEPTLQGSRIPIKDVFGKEVIVFWYKINDSKYKKEDCLYLQVSLKDVKHVVFTTAKALIIDVQKIPKDGFPFTTTIIKDEKRFLFT